MLDTGHNVLRFLTMLLALMVVLGGTNPRGKPFVMVVLLLIRCITAVVLAWLSLTL